MIVVVLSPHRDDAAFSLALAIDSWLAAGHTVSVLNCFTQSGYAPFSDVGTVHPNDQVSFASAVRKREDQCWNKLLGNKLSFHDLDLLDAPIRLACAVDEVLTVDIRPGDRAVARIEGAVTKLTRRAATTPLAVLAPLALGGHIDHRVVHQAVRQQLTQTPLPVAFYEDLPYATREGVEAEIEARAAEAASDLQAVFATEALPEPAEAVRRKTRIAECYDSQVDSAAVRAMAEFSLQYGGRERLWANEAFRQSGLALPADEERA